MKTKDTNNMNPPYQPTPRTDEATYRADCLGKTLVVNRNCAAALETELAAVQAECLEQARLLGISGSREASLIARAEKAETALAATSLIAERWEADALRYARNAEYWQSRAEKAEARSLENIDADMEAKLNFNK